MINRARTDPLIPTDPELIRGRVPTDPDRLIPRALNTRARISRISRGQGTSGRPVDGISREVCDGDQGQV